MQNCKVEICGVNTSKLTLLTEKQKIALINEMRDGNKTARETLIRGNLRLVLSVVQKFTNRGEQADDLFQVGCIGLMKSIDNFDTSHGVRFSTYAVPMIIGEIKRYLRDNSSIRVSRSIRDLSYKAMQAKEMLQNKNNNEPTVSEIAKELGVDTMDVIMSLESVSLPISLNEPLFSDGNDAVFIMDQIKDKEGENDWICEISLKQALKNLSEREKRILDLRFMKGKTQTQVAKIVSISQAQVSRLEKNALKTIKEMI